MAMNVTPFQSTDEFTMDGFNGKIAAVNSNVDSEIASALTGFARIETGSYVGTGTYGADNPNTLTFGFVPKLLIISDYYAANLDYVGSGRAIFFNTFPLNTNIYYMEGNVVNILIFTEWGKTVKWYSNSDASAQLNHAPSSGFEDKAIYRYLAIG